MGVTEGGPARPVYDLLSGRHSLVMSPNTKRPSGFASSIPIDDTLEFECALCPGNEAMLGPVIAELGRPWVSRATKNRWPIGVEHALVVLSNRHVGLYDLSVSEWAAGLNIMGLSGAGKGSIAFANHGVNAGASQPHAHAQVVRFPDEVPTLSDLAHCTGSECVLCAPLDSDTVIFSEDGWVCVSPAAPGVSYELRLFADTHRDDWSTLMAAPLSRMISASKLGAGVVDFNLIFHFAVGAHAHVHLYPRFIPVHAYSIGWGLQVVADPEEYAVRLRGLI